MDQVEENKEKGGDKPVQDKVIVKLGIIKLLLENSKGVLIVDCVTLVTEVKRPFQTS